MPVQNADIAEIFNKIADMLEIQDANPFRVRAYRNAARTVSSLAQSVSEMVAGGRDLTELSGIGKDLAAKIKEIVQTGSVAKLKELEGKMPSELNSLMKLPGLGPKKVRALYRELGIVNLEGLKKAAENGDVRQLDGFGRKSEEKILQGLEQTRFKEKRIKLIEAEQRAEPFMAYLKKTKGVKDIIVAGSFRRRKETVGDLDILATCSKGSKVMDRFVAYEDVVEVISKGTTRSSVLLRSGLQVDLRVVPQVSYGAALHYFTGSKAHNIAVRKLGVKNKLKINEYGVFKGQKQVAGRTEKDVYQQVGLPYIEPELRENLGELEAAQKANLPKLIAIDDIRGDLQAHTKETDGHASLEEMAEAARKLGYEYLAITEHSQKVRMAHGLDAARVAEQIKQIDRLNQKLDGFLILKGIEVDILEDGSLDLPDDILKQLDLTVCSIHYNFNLSQKKQTERILRAMDNPCFNILGHPTGRLINERPPYEVDMQRIIEAARDRGCILEVNAQPDRLDLADTYCKMAKQMGVKLVISTDAHSPEDLKLMRCGVDQARRGWVEPEDVINTRSISEVRKLIKRS
jgi:DNA polymerase (family 10)